MSAAAPTCERIRALNDAFRFAGPASGPWFLTPGVRALGPDAMVAIVGQICAFDRFIPDDDPYGEHDFGALRQDGEKLFWKIDYYDLAMQAGSDDPADPEVTRRVMTIMLASEY